VVKLTRCRIVLLIISLLIGLTKQYFGLFVDEADNMYVGWLISRDLFFIATYSLIISLFHIIGPLW